MTHDDRRADLALRFCCGIPDDELEEHTAMDWIWTARLRVKQQREQLDALAATLADEARAARENYAAANAVLDDALVTRADARAAWVKVRLAHRRVRNGARLLLGLAALALLAAAGRWLG